MKPVALEGALPEEVEAVWLIWQSRGHSRSEAIPNDVAAEFLREVRLRREQIEQQMVSRAQAGFSENRWFPRRQQRVALAILAVFVLVVVLVTFVFSKA